MARFELAVVYRLQGRLSHAEEQWKRALDECAGFEPACVGLAELYLDQGRWSEAQEMIDLFEKLASKSEMVQTVSLLRTRLQRRL